MSQILPISMAIFTILLIGVYYLAFISHSSQQGEEDPNSTSAILHKRIVKIHNRLKNTDLRW